jgi:predicted DNA-binding mobile mystery protein A
MPRKGWLRAIRDALGMPAEAFGRRLGISRTGALKIESSEAKGSISVARLRAAADALDCDVLVLVVPRRPLEETLRRRALEASARIADRTGHTMAMENQAVYGDYANQLRDELAQELMDQADPRLWDDP